MTAGPITFGYVWGLAADEESRRAVYVDAYPEVRARYQREQRGFARICELIALLEANEREFMAYLQAKRKKQTGDLGENDEAPNSRKQTARAG